MAEWSAVGVLQGGTVTGWAPSPASPATVVVTTRCGGSVTAATCLWEASRAIEPKVTPACVRWVTRRWTLVERRLHLMQSLIISSGMETCTPCATGRFANTTGTVQCHRAEKGKYVVSPGTAEPTDCPAGTWQDQEGYAFCFPCDKGTWSDQVGRTNRCWAADEGQEVPEEGRTYQTACALGHYSYHKRTEKCSPCPAGEPTAAQSVLMF